MGVGLAAAVTVADGREGDDAPPERVRNRGVHLACRPRDQVGRYTTRYVWRAIRSAMARVIHTTRGGEGRTTGEQCCVLTGPFLPVVREVRERAGTLAAVLRVAALVAGRGVGSIPVQHDGAVAEVALERIGLHVSKEFKSKARQDRISTSHANQDDKTSRAMFQASHITPAAAQAYFTPARCSTLWRRIRLVPGP